MGHTRCMYHLGEYTTGRADITGTNSGQFEFRKRRRTGIDDNIKVRRVGASGLGREKRQWPDKYSKAKCNTQPNT